MCSFHAKHAFIRFGPLAESIMAPALYDGWHAGDRRGYTHRDGARGAVAKGSRAAALLAALDSFQRGGGDQGVSAAWKEAEEHLRKAERP